ncbi:hypothetical protein AB0I91_07840 [Actinosynnema sp. NPDC049800]
MTCEKSTETASLTRQRKIGLAALAGAVSGAVRAIAAWILEHLLP